MNFMLGSLLSIAAVFILDIAQVQATAFTDLGNIPQQDENVLYKHPNQTGNPVFGFTNQTDTQVKFSNSETFMTTAGGQANLTTADGAINSVIITVPGSTYESLIFDPQKIGGGGTYSVQVTTTTGVQNFGPFTIQNGNNFTTITTDANQSIISAKITSTGGFTDLKQVRLGGVQAAAVPIPGTMLLFGAGFAGVVGWQFFQRKRLA